MTLPEELEPFNKNYIGQFGAYGKLWSEKVKKDIYAIPSIDEILDGIDKWLCKQYEERLTETH